MPAKNRTNKGDETFLKNQIADAFQATDRDQRITIAAHWQRGNFDHYMEFAAEHNLMPMALIIACLDEVSHPILGEARTFAGVSALIIMSEMRRGVIREVVQAPVDNSEVVHVGQSVTIEK